MSDSGDDYKVINRSALVLEPTPEFLAWVRAMPGDPLEMTVEDFRQDSSIYLLPDELEDTEAWLRRNFKFILEQELNDWCTDDSLWPKDLGYKTFCKFFKPQFHAVVVDLGKGPIEVEF
jgi:hypothetical protein